MFRDTKQQLQFAFNLAQYEVGHGSRLTLVRMALAQTGVQVEGGPDAEKLAALAKRTLATLRADLLGYERASLIAAFSRDWEERRTAVTLMSPLFRTALAHLVADPDLVDKLLRRHYIAGRERGPAWELPAIAAQFHTAQDRVARASQEIDKRARALEQTALDNLAALMQREVAHA